MQNLLGDSTAATVSEVPAHSCNFHLKKLSQVDEKTDKEDDDDHQLTPLIRLLHLHNDQSSIINLQTFRIPDKAS